MEITHLRAIGVYTQKTINEKLKRFVFFKIYSTAVDIFLLPGFMNIFFVF